MPTHLFTQPKLGTQLGKNLLEYSVATITSEPTQVVLNQIFTIVIANAPLGHDTNSAVMFFENADTGDYTTAALEIQLISLVYNGSELTVTARYLGTPVANVHSPKLFGNTKIQFRAGSAQVTTNTLDYAPPTGYNVLTLSSPDLVDSDLSEFDLTSYTPTNGAQIIYPDQATRTSDNAKFDLSYDAQGFPAIFFDNNGLAQCTYDIYLIKHTDAEILGGNSITVTYEGSYSDTLHPNSAYTITELDACTSVRSNTDDAYAESYMDEATSVSAQPQSMYAEVYADETAIWVSPSLFPNSAYAEVYAGETTGEVTTIRADSMYMQPVMDVVTSIDVAQLEPHDAYVTVITSPIVSALATKLISFDTDRIRLVG